MELDVSGILLGQFQAVILVVFVVQTVIEAVPALRGRLTPVVALVVGVLVGMAAHFAPAAIQEALGSGLALAAAASLTVRYVKRSGEERTTSGTPPPASVGVVEFPSLAHQEKRV